MARLRITRNTNVPSNKFTGMYRLVEPTEGETIDEEAFKKAYPEAVRTTWNEHVSFMPEKDRVIVHPLRTGEAFEKAYNGRKLIGPIINPVTGELIYDIGADVSSDMIKKAYDKGVELIDISDDSISADEAFKKVPSSNNPNYYGLMKKFYDWLAAQPEIEVDDGSLPSEYNYADAEGLAEDLDRKNNSAKYKVTQEEKNSLLNPNVINGVKDIFQ